MPSRNISPSFSLLQHFMPQDHQLFEAREARLNAYYETLQTLATKQISTSRGGNQIGSEVYLGGLPRKTPVITVGDLHGEINNLSRILLHDENLLKISRGEAVLLLLGDLIHPERNDCADMRSSLKTHELFMNLKIAHPHHVFALVGNHDPVFESVTKGVRTGGSRIDIPQSELYEQHMREVLAQGHGSSTEIQSFLIQLSACTEMSPLYSVGRTFAAAHAGPITGLDRKTLRNQHPIDNEASFQALREEVVLNAPPKLDPDLKRAYLQGCWSRFSSQPSRQSEPPLEIERSLLKYNEDDIREFLRTLNQTPGNPLIVGHTPPTDRTTWAEEIPISPAPTDDDMPPRFIRITATRDSLGYIKATGNGIEFIDL